MYNNTFDTLFSHIMSENNNFEKPLIESIVSFNEKPISKNIPTIDEIKSELLKLFKISTWNEFIDMQQAGQCSLIAKTICKMFPKVKMVSAVVNFSDSAKAKINDNESMDCIHYFNKIGKKYFDFAKGTNRYNGVYVMDGVGDMYDVNFNDNELSLITDIILENPKIPGFTLR